MGAFWGFIKKEFKHIFRDRKTLLILFGMPIAQILIFGFGITNEINNANIAVLDLSKDNHTQKIVNKLLSSGYFQIDSYLSTFSQIENTFKKGKVKLVIVFEEDFANKLQTETKASVQLLADASEPNTANTLIHYVSSIIYDYNRELNKEILINTNAMNVQSELRVRFNPELKGVFLFVPGTICIILMLVSAMMTSISITKEKETGSMELLLASPMNPALIIISKVIPYLLLSFTDAVIIVLIGNLVFGVPIAGSSILFFAEIALFIFIALSLGIFVSTKTNSQQTALMISLVGFMLPTILLSGFVYPIENMPTWLQYLTIINPARWFMIIIRGIMLKGIGLEYLWKETLILIGFATVFVLLSIKNFKIRLQS